MVAFAPTSSLVLGPLLLSGMDEFGVLWVTETIDGWEGKPQSSLAVTQRPRQGGGLAGQAYPGARSMAVGGRVKARTRSALRDAIDRLNDAVSIDDTLMTVTESGRSRWCMARQAGEVIAVTRELTARWSFQVVALDYRKLGDPLTGSTLLPSTTGGLTVPYTVPYSINAAQVSGQVSLFNPGNEPGPVTLRIDGPAPAPIITHVGSEQSLVFASSLTLGAGEWLDIDMDRREVLANGQASRSGWLTARGWSSFLPGDNTWAFTASGYDPASKLTVTATPADK